MLRPQEREFFTRPPVSTTKIILPFAAKELTLGGASLFVDQKDFEAQLRGLVGDAEGAEAFAFDLELLRLMDTLPSFDPFLMRERLRQSGRAPARCYFDVAEADVIRMREFVGQEIAQLVGLAFANAGAAGRELSQKLADKLMTDETAQALDPLRQTLRMSELEYREGVFAWKGFLYYKWLVDDFGGRLEELKNSIKSARALQATKADQDELAVLRAGILTRISEAVRRVRECLTEYGSAFAALSAGDASVFRDFLLKAPAMFLPMGEAIGVVKHIDSFWSFRFPGKGAPVMYADEALDIFTEFNSTLETVELVQGMEEAMRHVG